MKSAGKARSNGLYRHIRTSKEIIRNLLNDLNKRQMSIMSLQQAISSARFWRNLNPTQSAWSICSSYIP